MKLSSTGIRAVEKTGTESAAALASTTLRLSKERLSKGTLDIDGQKVGY